MPAGGQDIDGGCGEEVGMSLPPEVWAKVMECLPYESILSCSATCRSFLHEALPSLRKLRIDKSAQMNLKVAARFRDITDIQINSLLTQRYNDDDGEREIQVDLETSLRIVPFLSRFPQLERVSFRGKREGGGDIANFSPVDAYYDADDAEGGGGDRDRMLTVVDNISAAFRVGALPNNLQISGLVCPRAFHGRRNVDCETCLRACRSFPIESVAHFESRGSSRSNAKSGRSWPVDVCLQRSQIEFIVETRPGGDDLLRSKERLFRLLRRGGLRIRSDGMTDGQKFHIVRFEVEEIEELERAIQYAKIDPEKLPQSDVISAIMRSFASNEAGPLPPLNRRYLSEDSFNALKEIGFRLEKKSVYAPIEEMLVCLPLAAQTVLDYGNEEDEEDEIIEHDTELDCLRLIRRFLEMDTDCPVQAVIDTGIVPTLISRVSYYSGEGRKDMAAALHNILSKGTKEQRSVVVDDEHAAVAFSLCLTLSDPSVIECAVSALVHIAKGGKSKPADDMRKKDVIPKMVGLLNAFEQKHAAIVERSLRFLSLATKDDIRKASSAGLLSRLASIMLSSNDVCVLAHCSFLLRRMFGETKGTANQIAHIQAVLRLELVPRLIELLNAKKDDTTMINLAGVVVLLMSGPSNELTKRLLEQNEGLIAVLVDLFDSPDVSVAAAAMRKVGNIAHDSPGLRDQMMVDSGVVDTLLCSIERSTHLETLRTATLALVQICCEGQPSPVKFVTRKIGALLPLLIHEEQTVADSAWRATFSLLGGFKGDWATEDEVNATINPTFVEPMLKRLSNTSLDAPALAPAMKCIHLISTMGDAGVRSIGSNNGLATLKELLCSPHGLHERIHEPACNTFANIITGDKQQLQKCIDLGFVQCFVKMTSAPLFRVKQQALRVLHLTAKGGTSAQIEQMVTHGCIPALCSMLSEDATISGVALSSLDVISKVVSLLKVPPSEFPKELSSEKDLDPSTPEELSHIFTPDGMVPMDGTELVEQYQEAREIPTEGHFAQCAVCIMADTIGDDAIRCTKCPRAYHKKCVEQSCSEDAVDNEKWECMRCQLDREIQKDDEIPTTTVADRKVEKTYAAYKDGSASFAYMAKMITELLAILDKLTTFDYGWIFAAPVSTEEVKDYLSVIKKPMDYGTIARRLEEGENAPSPDKPHDLDDGWIFAAPVSTEEVKDYLSVIKKPMDYGTIARRLEEGEYAPSPDKPHDLDEMEELVLYALMDISQVHYNCFLYNLPGSQYSRSGEVQQRKWRAYYNKYLKEGLPESVQARLDSFLETCEKERREAVHDRRFQTSGTPNNTTAKAVAVFDPDTKMIVKQYSSKTAARNAAMILQNAGYDCEVELTQSNSKTRMEHAEDPSKTLFGYQWLPMETLKSGNFKVRPSGKVGTASLAAASSKTEIDKKLTELMDENTRLESEIERVGLLEKKGYWVDYDEQHQYVESLAETCKFFEEKSTAIQEQLKSFENDVASKRPLKHFRGKVKEKHSELAEIITCQKNDFGCDLKRARAKLAQFQKDAEEHAPKEEWEERLSGDDIPTDRAGVCKALGASRAAVKTITADRRSTKRMIDIEALKTALEVLFKKGDEEDSEDVTAAKNAPDDAASKKRKRSGSVDSAATDAAVSGEAPVETSGKETAQKTESSTKPKKKKQRGIAAFFGKASK